MKQISLVTIRTPDQTLSFQDVDWINLVTEDGPLVVYAKHASLTAKISFSVVRVKHGNLEEGFMVRNGLLFINNDQNSVTLLAYTLDQVTEVSIETIEAYLARVKDQLAGSVPLLPIQFRYLENERLTLIQQLTILRKQ
jgi:F0F1-type ATP synthase epsilon subunit